MPGYIISLSGNTLKLSKTDATEEVFTKALSKEVADDSLILNTELFSESLGQLILDSYGEKVQKLPFNFLVEPENIHLSFLTTTQKEKDEQSLLHEASKKLAATALTLDDVYYSYQKIAPFVYQFVAIKKNLLEKYVEISNTLGFELKSVIPWVSLLPKSKNQDGSPAIFLVNNESSKFMILAELSGVYYIGDLEGKDQNKKIEDLIQELSVYERKEPIKTIYTFNVGELDFGDSFKVSALDYANLHDFVVKNSNTDIFEKQANLLNLFPVPVVEKNNALVYVGSAVGIALLIGGFVLLKPFNKLGKDAQIAGDHDEVAETQEASNSVVTNPTPTTEQPVTEQNKPEISDPTIELNRAYLKVMVENGTNIGGLAGKTRDLLTPLGYEVIGVGDSVKSDVSIVTIEISAEADAAGYTKLLVEDLKGLYTDVEVHTLPQPSTDYDVLITAGANLK